MSFSLALSSTSPIQQYNNAASICSSRVYSIWVRHPHYTHLSSTSVVLLTSLVKGQWCYYSLLRLILPRPISMLRSSLTSSAHCSLHKGCIDSMILIACSSHLGQC